MGDAVCRRISLTNREFGQQLAERIKLTAEFNLGLMAKLHVKYILIS